MAEEGGMMPHAAIRKHIYDQAGIADGVGRVNYSEQKRVVWDRMHRFFDLCCNRILMGRFRYGEFKAGYKDYLEDLKRCLRNYEKTRNTEFLIDLANYCEIEFDFGTHPDKHFKSMSKGIKYEAIGGRFAERS